MAMHPDTALQIARSRVLAATAIQSARARK